MGKISSLEVLRLRAIKRASPDKSVTRFTQDDDFVVSWRCKKQRLLGFLLSARQVSAYGRVLNVRLTCPGRAVGRTWAEKAGAGLFQRSCYVGKRDVCLGWQTMGSTPC